MIPKVARQPGITYQIERFTEGLLEGRVLSAAHWKEFGNRQDIREFDVDYPKYLSIDAQGRLLSATARRGDMMVGYLVMVVCPDPHASGGKMAESAFYYTIPHPMRGLILRGMIRCIVRHLLDNGVRYIRFRHRLKQTAQPILENLGFVLDELSYSLNIDKFKG